MIRVLIIALCLSGHYSNAQDRIEFQLDSTELEQNYTIETLRFYISNIQLYGANGTHFKEENSCHLIDLEDPDSWIIDYPSAKFNVQLDSISFLIGTDSLANVSGILEGDLDPIKGMYWAWNSGYINFKVEGKQHATKSKFEYHLGGYLPPFATACECTFPLTNSGEVIQIKLNLSQFLDQMNMEELNEVMIPGPEAVDLSNKLSSCFSVE